jgi:vitamin B12 transporter
MRRVAWCVIAGVLVWTGNGAALADPDKTSAEDEPVEAKEVVVSATKTPLPIAQVTSAVEVITEEDLQKRHVKTVVDALRFSQGLAVFSNGGPGTTAAVRIRGGSDTHTLVLIDGAIVNSATLGSYNFANLTTDNIERIEILRGAQSMLYGSDAIGGVINIITKRGTGTPQVNGFFEGGSFGSLREGGGVSGQKGPVDFSFTLSRWDFTGFSVADYRLGATERDAFRNWTASTKIGVALPHDGRLEFVFRWMNSDIRLDNISSPPQDVLGSKTREQELVFGASYEQRFTNWWSQKLTLARDENQSLFIPGTIQRNLFTGAMTVPFGTPNETRVVSNRLEVQENFQVFKPLSVTAGYQLRDQQGENDIGLTNKIIRSNAGFAEAKLNLWDRAFATAGVRHDSYNVFGDATTYRLTAGYLIKETGTKFRTSYATGFRAPTLNQLFFPNFGNPTLGPEKSLSFDVGVDQYLFADRVRISAGYFWNRYRDLIVNALDEPSCAPFSTFLSCPLNIGSATSKGYEVGLSVVILRDHPLAKQLEVQGQYTNTMTRDESTHLRLPRWPVDQWSGLILYRPIEPLLITLSVRYVGSRFNDVQNRQAMKPFDVWTVTASYDITKQVQLYTRAENVFNENYQEILNAGTPVSSIYAGLNARYDLPWLR